MNIKIPAESIPTRPLSPFPSINLPEALPILNGVIVAAPQQQLSTNRLSHNDGPSGFARRMSESRQQLSQEQEPLHPPLSLREDPSSPVRERVAPQDPKNQHFEMQPPISVQDRLGSSVFALPPGFSALPPHITVAEAFLSQETSDRWSQQQSVGHGAPLFAPNNAADEGVNPHVLDQKGTDNTVSADDEWALAFGSSPEGSEQDNKANPTFTDLEASPKP
jgi:hypothetical protein